MENNSAPQPILHGNKVFLRPITMSDATVEYVTWLNDENVKKGLESPPDNYSLKQLQEYLKNILAEKNTHMFAIIAKDKNKHIGNIKLHNFNIKSRTCEIGIMIGDKNYWGRGFGKECCKLAIHYAFDKLGIAKVWLAVHSNNHAAIKLYENLGFEIEGRLKKHTISDGKLVDKIIMGLFPENFRQ